MRTWSKRTMVSLLALLVRLNWRKLMIFFRMNLNSILISCLAMMSAGMIYSQLKIAYDSK